MARSRAHDFEAYGSDPSPETTEPEVEAYEPESEPGFLESHTLIPTGPLQQEALDAVPREALEGSQDWDMVQPDFGSDEPWAEAADLDMEPIGDGPFPEESDPDPSTFDKLQSVLRQSNGYAPSLPPLNKFKTPAPENIPEAFRNREIQISRKRNKPKVKPKAEPFVAQKKKKESAPPRNYPKMLALLQNVPKPKPPAVAGTFIPKPPPPPRRTGVEVDKLLSLMAEGLMVGQTKDGGSEIRITLRDEFFCGTELRIEKMTHGMKAILRPPNASVRRQLEKERHALRAKLEAVGLRGSSVEVEIQ